MSLVTNIVLATGLESPEAFLQVNSFFRGKAGLYQIDSDCSGGDKNLECSLAVGAFNYLDLDAFTRHLQVISWEYPESVQLFVKEQEDDRFRMLIGVPASLMH